MILLLIAGIIILLGGLAAIGFGIPVQEFSFGNTLILAGTGGACTGAILIGLAVVVRELKGGVRRLGRSDSEAAAPAQSERRPPPETEVNERSGNDGFSFDDRPGHNVSDVNHGVPASSEQPDMREPVEAEVADTAPPAKARRNLLFASSSRKERERAAAKTSDPVEGGSETAAPSAPPVSKPVRPPPSFDDAWPPSGRGRVEEAPSRTRAPPIPNESNSGPPGADRYPAGNAEQPPVTVLKSGIVDGMAYSLYSDGSIEAQMPEGMMRFASIDELRSHLDQRP